MVPSPTQLQTLALRLGPPKPVADDQIAVDDGNGQGARITWSVGDRFDSSWDAHRLWWGYEQGAAPEGNDIAWLGYDPDFVQPGNWRVNLNGCGSKGPKTITKYMWQLEGPALGALTFETGRCAADAVYVPAEGEYQVTLTVSTSDGWTSTASGTIVVDDILIVSLGDSSASGEGNPDSGAATLLVDWEFDACHRSARSSHARAAEAIEDADPHTSVTFLSFACSGASIENVLGPYRGIDPDTSGFLDDGQYLPAQVEALARSLCGDRRAPVGSCPPGMMRDVDVLLLQIGINDANFKHILFACMNYPQWLVDLLGSVFSKQVVQNLIDYFSDVDGRLHDVASLVFDRPDACNDDVNLVNRFANDLIGMDTAAEPALALVSGYEGNTYGAIRRRLEELNVRVGEVIAVTYPGPWGRSDGDVERGCGAFLLVNEGEAEWMHEDAALELNQLIELEAMRNDWWAVPARGAPGGADGLMDRFQEHGYCAGPPASSFVPVVGFDSYFVPFTASLIAQFNMEGTIHPNASGHSQTAQAILDALAAPKPDRVPDTRVTILLESVRLSSLGLPAELIGADGLVELDFSAWAAPQQRWRSTTPPPDELSLFGNVVRIVSRADEARAPVRVAPDVWTALPAELTLTVDVAPADQSVILIAGSPDPGFVSLVTAALRLSDDPHIVDFEDILVEPDPDLPDPGGQGDPGYTEGGWLRILRVLDRLGGGSSYGAGTYTDRTVSSPGYLDIRYCVFVGDIPRGIVRPGQQVLRQCQIDAKER